MISGVIYSFIVSLFYSLYLIPRKFSKQSPALYTAYLSLAYFLTNVVWYSITLGFRIGERETLSSVWHLLSILRGCSWAVGAVLLHSSIDKIGIGKSAQWKNLQGPIGSILMLVFLHEASGWKVVFIVSGIFAIFISAVLFTVRKENEKKSAFNIGILYAVLAACSFGINVFVQKILVNHGFVFSQLVYTSLSSFILAAAMFFIQNRKKDRKESFILFKQAWLPLTAGVLFGVAIIFLVLANSLMPGSISFSIVQLNTVWTLLIGIFVFKEISFIENRPRIITGLIFAIGAITLLMLAL